MKKLPDSQRDAAILILIASIGLFAAACMAWPALVRGQTLQWSQRIVATTGWVSVADVGTDSAGNVYAAITYTGRNTLATAVSNATDAAIASWSPTGQLRWVSPIAGVEYQQVFALAVGDDGYIYTTGTYAGQMTYGNSVGAVGPGDVWIAKTHAESGTPLWVRSYGSTSDEAGRGIAYRDGRICAAGLAYAALAVGGGVMPPLGGADAWAACYDAAEGAFLWSQRFGGPGLDNAFAIAMDGAGAAYVGGRYTGTMAAGSRTLTSSGATDAYVAKFHADGTSLWLSGPLPGRLYDQELKDVAVQDGTVAAVGWSQQNGGVAYPTTAWLATLGTLDGATRAVQDWGYAGAVSSLATTGNGVAFAPSGALTLVGFTSAPLFGDAPFTQDVFTVTDKVGARYVETGHQYGNAVAYMPTGQMVLAANDGNNAVVRVIGDAVPTPASTATPDIDVVIQTPTRTFVPTWTPTRTAVPATATLSPSPRPTNTPAQMPTCAKPSNAPCVVE